METATTKKHVGDTENHFSKFREPTQRCKKLSFEIWIIDCRRNAHQNWPKIIHSLTYSTKQVYILPYFTERCTSPWAVPPLSSTAFLLFWNTSPLFCQTNDSTKLYKKILQVDYHIAKSRKNWNYTVLPVVPNLYRYLL